MRGKNYLSPHCLRYAWLVNLLLRLLEEGMQTEEKV